MDKSTVHFINDVMSSDDPPSSLSSKCSDSDTTIISHDDVILSSLLDESESITRSISNIFSQESGSDDKNFHPGPTDTNNGNKVLVQTLQDALTWRTMELTDREKEYFNLKANYETMSYQLDMMNTGQSNLRSQIALRDKEIKQLQQKVNSLEDNSAHGDYQQMRLELERTRIKMHELKKISDSKTDNLATEVQLKEEIIEHLHHELTQSSRQRPLEMEHILREKSTHWERSIKLKDEQIQSLQQQLIELESIIKDLQDVNKCHDNNIDVIQDLQEEIAFLKEQIGNANKKNVSLNDILENSKRFYEEFKENAEHVMKCDINTMDRMKQEYKELERKHRDCLITLTQQGDSNSQLMKEMKILHEKMRNNEMVKGDYEKRIQSLSLEKTEFIRTIENLQEQLADASIIENNLNRSFQNETDSKQIHIDQLSQEIVHLSRNVDDLKDKIRIRDTTIEKLNEQIVDCIGTNERNVKTIKTLEEKMISMSHQEKILENDLKEKAEDLTVKEFEMKNSKDQIDNLSEELRKIHIERNDFERSMKRKEEAFNLEITEKDEVLQSVKSELTKINLILNNEKEMNQRLTMENEKYMKSITTMTMKINKLSDDLEDKISCVEDMIEKEKRLQNHNKYLEEELAQIKLALDDTTQELHRIKNSRNFNENALEMCKNEAKMQQETNFNLIQKIEQRDQLLQRLTTETSKLKQKYQDRQSDITKLTKENQSLKLTSDESESYVKEIQQKFDITVKKKDSQIDQLKAELTEVQSNYTQCYETLLRKEDHLNRYQHVEKDQSLKMGEAQKEISRLQLDYDELESELNAIRAKYRACQEELHNRDGHLSDLKNELHLLQQDTFELQSERMVCHQEIERWKDKCSELQTELARHINEAEILDDKLGEKDHINDELQSKLQIVHQKVENYERTIDQLKTDINLGKSTNNDRYNHFQSIITSLKNEISDRRQEYQLLEEKCSNYKSQITKLKGEQEHLQQSISTAQHEIEATNDRLKNKDAECQHWIQQTQSAQYLNEEVKISLDSLEKEITFTKQQLDAKETKLHSNAEAIIKLKAERNQNYKNFLDCKCQLDSVMKDRDEITRVYQENDIKLRKYEQVMKDMTEELSNAQVEICNFTNRISKLESELKFSALSEAKKQAQIEEMENKISKLKTNYSNYKSQFKTSENDVENLNTLLMKQTRRCAELENSLSKLKNEKEVLLSEKDKTENKSSQDKTNLEEKNKELERTISEKEQKMICLEEKHQKHLQEIKKMKSFSKQAEEDIAKYHKTIDDLQNQLEYKQNQLRSISKTSEALENQLDKKNREVNQLELRLTEFENEIKTYRSSRDSESDRLSFLQKEIESLQAEVKNKTNKILDLTVECTKYQTMCSNLEDQIKRTERKMLKYESECKALRSSFTGYNREVSELRSQQHNQVDVMEKTRTQYEKFFSDFNALKQEIKQEKKINSQFASETENLKIQLQGRVQHQRLLEEQIEEQENIISQLQNEMVQERKKNEDLQRIEFEKERTIQSIETETETLSQTKTDLQLKLRDKENLAKVRQQELELSNKKIQQLTEALMDKENKLKITEKRYQLSESEVRNLRENLSRIETMANSSDTNSDRPDGVSQFHMSNNCNQKEVDQLRSEFHQVRNENSQLRIACQAKDNDIQRMMKEKEQLQARYSELSSNKHELSPPMKKRAQNIEEENENLLKKIRKMQYELEERDKLLLENHDESMKKLTQRLMKFQNEEMEYENKFKQLQTELNYRNEKMATLTSKYEKVSLDNTSLIGELKQCGDKIRSLKNEKETIVENFNSWIQEQKLANEKLGDKIRDQNKVIQELRKEKGYLEREKIKYLHGMKQHENQQIASESTSGPEIDDLKKQLYTTERQFEMSIAEKGRTIENLQSKIFDHKNEIAHLKDQISVLQRNHQKTVKELEQAVSYAESFRDINDGKHIPLHGQIRPFKKGAGDNKYITKEDENSSLDKQYWIRRVGELSEELQKSREYWSNKVKEISNNLDSSTITDETLSTLSS